MREQRRFHEGWFARPKQNRFAEMRGAADPPLPVTLPHDSTLGTTRDPAGAHQVAYFRGGVWEYTTTLHVPEEWRERRASLFFEGVYRDAKVTVNDDIALVHEYGYGEFLLRLDPYLRFGEDNSITVECRTHEDARWYAGSGIYRPLSLIVTDPVHVAHDGVTITTPEVDADGALVSVATLVENEAAHTRTVRVAHELTDTDGNVVVVGSAPITLRPNSSATCRQRLYLPQARRWSAEHPHLYSCRTSVAELLAGSAPFDEVVDTFGVRTLTADPRHGLRVNGETVKLRGACIHHDNGPLGVATIDRAEERRVEIMKAAGFNALRSAHNPMSRAMLAACDRLGMYVMDEAFDVWNESKNDFDYTLRFPSTWRDEVASMVAKDRNCPSVILYSTGNEIPDVGTPLGSALAREIAEHVRALDPTRLVTNALQPLLSVKGLIPKIAALAAQQAPASAPSAEEAENMGVNTAMLTWETLKVVFLKDAFVGDNIEETAAGLDVAGYNYLDERYEIDRSAYPNRVIVGSETYPKAIGRCWPQILASDHVIGDFTWTGWDYLGEVGIGRTDYASPDAAPSYLGEYPWLTAHCGDIDITGDRLPQSYYREVVYGLRAAPYIAVHRPEHHGKQIAYTGPWSWTDSLGSWSWPGHEGAPVCIDVYSASDEVELLLNGRSLGRRATGVSNDFRTVFDAVYEPGELVAVAYTAGVESGRQALASATGSTVLAATVDRSRIRADESDLAYVAIEFVDANGVVQPCAAAEVTVQVEGPAMLQGLASGNPKALDPFTGASCATYDGRALAVVRPTGAGSITVTVTAEGCAPARVAIEAMEVGS
jgi:beta-galactosidase